jgi:Arc/MetJ-type ribon-helix-helix transcriptional regulator
MSRITFRADDDLVRRLEEFDASKSEVMRDALRAYLDGADRERSSSDRNVETLLAKHAFAQREPPEINVNVTLDGHNPDRSDVSVEGDAESAAHKTRSNNAGEDVDTREQTCSQCGEKTPEEYVHCPNCGEKSSHRVFCDCGDEIRSDWAFCPGCGRRTPAADVLDQRKQS